MDVELSVGVCHGILDLEFPFTMVSVLRGRKCYRQIKDFCISVLPLRGKKDISSPLATIVVPLCGMETSHIHKNINRLPILLYALCPLLTTFVKTAHLV